MNKNIDSIVMSIVLICMCAVVVVISSTIMGTTEESNKIVLLVANATMIGVGISQVVVIGLTIRDMFK